MNIVDCKTIHNLLLRNESHHLSLLTLAMTITGGYSVNVKKLGKYLLKMLLVIFLLIQTYSCANKSIENQVKVDTSKKAEPQSEKYEAYYHFSLSRLNFLRGNFEEAIREIETAEKYDPNSAYIKYNIAVIYMSVNRYTEALYKLEESVRVNPGFAPSHTLLGKIYASSEDPEKKKRGVKELKMAIELDPNDSEAHLFLGIIETESKEYDKAEISFKRVIELIPDDERGYYFLGRLNPVYPSALLDLAIIYEKQGKLDESENIYKELVTLFPSSFDAYVRYGNFLFRINRLSEAAIQFKKAQQLDYQNPDLKLRLGLLYLEKEEYEKAIEEFQLILFGSPEDERAKYYLALCYTQIGRSDESLKMIKEALKHDPDNEQIVNYLGALYRKLNRNEEGIKLYEDFVVTHPKSELIYYSLGVSYYFIKNEDKSVLSMKKVLEINPDHADALNFIGYSYAESGKNLEEAERLVKRAIEISPNKGYMIDSLGWIYYKKGNLDKAIELLEKAAELTGDDPNIMEHLGDVYNDKGDRLKALEYYERGLELINKNQDLDEEEKELKTRLETKINVLRQKIGSNSRQGEI